MISRSVVTTTNGLDSRSDMNHKKRRRRVVVTGLGAVTPLGSNLLSSWNNLVSSHDKISSADPIGITTLERALLEQDLDSETLELEMKLSQSLPCQVAAPVRGIGPCDTRTSRVIQLALLAGKEAMHHSKLSISQKTNGDDNDNIQIRETPDFSENRHRMGASIGTGMSSAREILQAQRNIEKRKGSLRRLSPHFVPTILANGPSGRLAQMHDLRGPNLAPSTACAAGAHAIGDAFRVVQSGDADVMLAGGTESCIDPLSMAGFCRLQALSTKYNEEPSLASRPFDENRDGFVVAEGAALLVLEDLDHALNRGLQEKDILCEIVGYGASCDAHHVTSPHPDGLGALSAMQKALDDCHSILNHTHQHIDYINAHATSTPMGDGIEWNAICQMLSNQKNNYSSTGTTATTTTTTTPVYVSSTKGKTGHLLGATGALEAAFTIMAIYHGKIPPTWNLHHPSDRDDHELAKHVYGTQWLELESINVAMSNSFGFGGTNASLVFQRYTHS
eukprot:CAMPEP_0184861344 /NCGR_PEP_ID=MMETSP0580-20130426/6049_1 /TAXON_ID=1118495 /ORGANISM="Dactyliosolen fragilissimus" /LENGTH=504 /DNA_ID=CAMNT_0027358799 /DNA_START=160 /DNA_END=1674 /DNA_ORIENTATION=+